MFGISSLWYNPGFSILKGIQDFQASLLIRIRPYKNKDLKSLKEVIFVSWHLS